MDDEEALRRKKTRTAQYPDFDRAVYDWFVQALAAGKPVSGYLITAQASALHKQMTGDDFEPSTGWLNRWKQRHGVNLVKQSGESKSADVTAATEFQPKLQVIMDERGLCKEQVYNCDETGLFYKSVPNHTLALRIEEDRSHGYKVMKDRVTLLLACNWEGTHKLKPLLIGKFKSPRCFHHINRTSLPLLYDHSRRAWMTASIFKEWFHRDFVPAVRRHLRKQGLEEKAVLVLDNCTAHPADDLTSKDGKISAVFLPKNTTSLIQPLDQGIISNFKRNYRKELMKALIADNRDITSFLKTINVKDVIYFSAAAWDAVKPLSIRNTWQKIFGEREEEPEDEDLFSGFSAQDIRQAEEKFERDLNERADLAVIINGWATCDEDCPGSTDEPDEDPTTVEEEEEPEPELPAKYSGEDLVKAAEMMVWMAEAHDLGTVKILHAKDMLRHAKKAAMDNKRQSTITELFLMNATTRD